MNKIQLSRGELSNVAPYTGPKKPRKGWETVALCCFSVLLKSMESLLKSSIQITNKSYSALKDTYMTLTNMNQSRIEIGEGAVEIRVFKIFILTEISKVTTAQ